MSSANATFWLSLIAIASVVQATLLVAVAIRLFRAASTMRSKVDELHTRELAPLMTRARHLLDDVDDAVQRVRTMDDDVRHAVSNVSTRIDRLTSLLRRRVAPVAGVMRGARAVLASLANRRGPARTARTPIDAEDEARFFNEGGAHHARN
jgi:hypothetical protein